jgi:hypothetical protein
MLIALLAVRGVDLVVIVVLLAFVLSRERWVMKRRGAFRGVIRAAKGPFLFRNELVPTDRLDEQRAARTDEVKRLGDHPCVIRLTADSAAVEVAAKAEDTELLLGPLCPPAMATAASVGL